MFWPYDVAWAIRCTRSESQGYKDFTGRAGERGPWMIHPMHARNGLLQHVGVAWDDMPTDPAAWTMKQIKDNTAVAVALYDERGKKPWHAPGCR